MAAPDDPPSGPSRSRRGRPPQGVREAVLAAAEAILAEAGVARLSTKAVAQRAGVAESSIFYHFGDRLGLLQAVVQHYLPPVKEALAELDSHGSLRDDLVELMDTLEAFFVRTIPVAAAVQSDAELRKAFTERSRELGIGPHRAVDGVLAHLTAERANGHLPGALDLRATALILVGAAHQRALQRHLSPPEAVSGLPSSGAVVDTLMPALNVP